MTGTFTSGTASPADQASGRSTMAIETDDGGIPDHLVALAGGEWRLWRLAAVRATGMPVCWIEDLTTPELVETLDRAAEARCKLDAAATSAEHALQHSLGRDDYDPELARGLTAIRKGVRPKGSPDTWMEPVADYVAALDRVEEVSRDMAEVFASEAPLIADKLVDRTADPLFLEAVAWQNRELAEYLAVRRSSHKRNSKQRQRLGVIARHLQRYCLKNDSIGFFGPIGWAELDPDSEVAVEHRPGPVIAERSALVEQWCIDALCRVADEDPGTTSLVPPRRLPTVATTNRGIRVDGKYQDVSGPQLKLMMSVLELCDGRHQPAEILQELIDQGSPVNSRSRLDAVLELMERADLITRSMVQPLSHNPEQRIREAIAGLRSSPAGGQGTDHLSADLATLVKACDEVTDAAGEPDKLLTAFAALEETFTEMTGRAATRSRGATYAGRTLVYEDCRRGGHYTVGASVLDRHGPALSLILDSSRWMGSEYARLFNAAFTELYHQLASIYPTVDVAVFWKAAAPILLTGTSRSIVDQVQEGLQRRWSDLIGPLAPGRMEVRLRSRDLEERAKGLFAASGPGWAVARYQCPDLLFGQNDNGSYLVLGEHHIVGNTLRNNLFISQHPEPTWFQEAFDRDIPESNVRPLLPRELLSSARLAPNLDSDRTWLLLLSDESSWMLTHPRAVAAADAVVECGQHGPEMRTADGARIHLLDVFAEPLAYVLAQTFTLMGERPHTPRIWIDDLAIARQRWSFAAADLEELISTKSESERMIRLSQWCKTAGISRRVFVKSPLENKPLFIDFASPELVALFCKLVRSGRKADSRLTLSEMLPAPEDLWLQDDQGFHYTSEFRIVAVDPRSPYVAASTGREEHDQ